MRSRLTNDSRRTVVIAGSLLALATVLAYANSLSGPFVFDDVSSIETNLTIRHLWPLSAVLSSPAGLTVGGRPLVNLTLALNYAVSGTAVWSYHLGNLLIHLLAGLTLFGVLRRTLARARSDNVSLPLAATVALIWLVHPLQTESVTYIVQRAESLVSLCYLLTLYCAIRAIEAPTRRRWSILAVAACVSGMATKEVMVSAPLIVLLYDRIFVAGTFRAAWRDRRGLYVGLCSSWLVLGYLLATHGRGPTVGYGIGISIWSYALTQCWAIVRYLSLAWWPHPLIFDYGPDLVPMSAQGAGCIVLVVILIAGTVIALWRRPRIGFAAAAFFALLAPTSSIVPIATQTIAEHRMYLALAPVVTLAVLGLYALIGRKVFLVGIVWALLLGWTTVRRNQDYQSELSLWQDTAAKWPGNPRAQHYLGDALALLGRPEEGLPRLQDAVHLDPADYRAQSDLGRILGQLGRLPEALDHFELALRLNPDLVEARFNEAITLVQMGRMDEGRKQFEKVIEKQPDFPGAHADLGDLLSLQGRMPEAEQQYLAALRLDPNSADLHVSMGRMLAVLNRWQEAADQFEMALAINPNLAPAHNDLGKALANLGRLDEAIAQFQAAVQIDPGFAEASDNLKRARRP